MTAPRRQSPSQAAVRRATAGALAGGLKHFRLEVLADRIVIVSADVPPESEGARVEAAMVKAFGR